MYQYVATSYVLLRRIVDAVALKVDGLVLPKNARELGRVGNFGHENIENLGRAGRVGKF